MEILMLSEDAYQTLLLKCSAPVRFLIEFITNNENLFAGRFTVNLVDNTVKFRDPSLIAKSSGGGYAVDAALNAYNKKYAHVTVGIGDENGGGESLARQSIPSEANIYTLGHSNYGHGKNKLITQGDHKLTKKNISTVIPEDPSRRIAAVFNVLKHGSFTLVEKEVIANKLFVIETKTTHREIYEAIM